MKTLSVVHASLAVLCLAAPATLSARASLQPNAVRSFVVYRANSPASPPTVKAVIGTLTDHVCRRPWDMAATDAEALAPLEARARGLGANGLVDVKFDRRRTDFASACWQKVTVTGTAAVLVAPDASWRQTADARP